MRSFAVFVLVVALVGEGLCGRLRRQLASDDTGSVPEGVIPDMGSAPEGVGPDMDGAPEGVATMATDPKVDGLNAALTMMIADCNTPGAEVDPKKVDSILKLSLVVGVLGGEVNEANKQGIADLLESMAPADSPAAEA